MRKQEHLLIALVLEREIDASNTENATKCLNIYLLVILIKVEWMVKYIMNIFIIDDDTDI